MSEAQIKTFDSSGLPRMGITDYGVYVKNSHIELARKSLNSRLFKSKDLCPLTKPAVNVTFPDRFGVRSDYEIQPNPKDLTNPTSGTEKVRVALLANQPKVLYPLRPLKSDIYEWERDLRVHPEDYKICKSMKERTYAKIRKPINLANPKIMISAYCIALAVVRAGIMHELHEVRIAVKYGYSETDVFSEWKPHILTVRRQNSILDFENQTERNIREYNVKACTAELSGICGNMKLNGFEHERFYEKCKKLKETIEARKYIPGYCEIYKKEAYHDPAYSSIASYFKEAAGKWGIFPCAVIASEP